MGGVAQVAVGDALCGTGLGCVLGVPLVVVGLSNIGEGVTGFRHPRGEGFSVTTAAIQRVSGASDGNSAKLNAALNLGLDLASLNVPHAPLSLAQSMKAFRSNGPLVVVANAERAFVSAAPKYTSGNFGILTNIALEANTVSSAF